MSSVTYLSDYVHRIIVEFSETVQCELSSGTCESCPRKFVGKDLTYNWSGIGGALGEITDDFEILDHSEAWYLEKSQLVWNVMHEAGSAVLSATNEERESFYQLCDWADCQTDMVEYVYENKEEDCRLLAVLVLTAGLERALGNVYMTKTRPVPFLLRDLLRTPELTCIFGKVPIVFTQLLVGCPRGLNLRNVAWHGFLSPGELHRHLMPGLTVLIASLGKILQECQVIPKRPQLLSFESYARDLSDIFPNIDRRQDDVEDMIDKSIHIPEKVKIFWKKAYYLLQSERYGYSLVLLMPQLEHCLRVLYCRVNDCPARLLTAESTAFYTTLDEILAPSQNAVVGSGLLMLLLDVTSSLSGPRLRDRLSHGEIHLPSVPPWIANFVFCSALATAHSDHGSHFEDGNHCNSLCAHLQEAVSRYHSKFHVVAAVRRQLTSLLDRWPSWRNCPQPADVAQPVSCKLVLALDQLMFPGRGDITEKLKIIGKCVESCELPTLYRPKTELELAATLDVILCCVAQTAEKVCRTASTRHQLWCDRELRSRARATAVRMWSVLPDVWTTLLCCVMVVTLLFRQLPELVAKENQLVFRLVKAMRKAVENTVTLCDAEKNRWTEAHHILSDLSAKCIEFFANNAYLLYTE